VTTSYGVVSKVSLPGTRSAAPGRCGSPVWAPFPAIAIILADCGDGVDRVAEGVQAPLLRSMATSADYRD
jgi:hypothetical protein